MKDNDVEIFGANFRNVNDCARVLYDIINSMYVATKVE